MPTIRTDALTTLARAKMFLSISGDTYDGILTMLINQVTGYLESYLKRPIKQATYTHELYNGTGTNKLILKTYPVASITSIEERNSPDNVDEWTTINSQYYQVDLDNGVVTYTAGRFIETPNRYRITYIAGYLIDFNNEANSSLHTLPQELEYVCHKLISAVFNTRKGEGITSQKVGDISVVYNQTVFGSKEISDILEGFTTPTV